MATNGEHSERGAHPMLIMVRDLRQSLAGKTARPVDSAAGTLEALERSLGQVLGEHRGMADDLLRVYEQLGIVFEVTRCLPSVKDEKEVLRLFVNSLASTYPTAHVRPAYGEDDPWLAEHYGDATMREAMRETIRRCRTERIVVVANACNDEGKTPADGGVLSANNGDVSFGKVLCAPVFAGDEFVCGLVLELTSEDEPSGPGCMGGRQFFEASDTMLMDCLAIFCGDLIRNFRLLDELRHLSVNMVRSLVSAVDQKDPYTSGHSIRVAHYATSLGKEIGLGAKELQMLEWSALLHDVGKIGIRDDVLKKEGKLTDEEFEHIKEHPVRSRQVVSGIPQLSGALDGATHHHEHWQGGGYPDGLVGEQIPLQARIIQIADVFDALTSTRSYRKAFGCQKALDILREEAGRVVDPNLAATFERMIRHWSETDAGWFARLHRHEDGVETT